MENIRKLDYELLKTILEFRKFQDEKDMFVKQHEHIFTIYRAYEEALYRLRKKNEELEKEIESEIGEKTNIEGKTFYVKEDYEDIEIIDYKQIPEIFITIEKKLIRWNLIEGKNVPGAKLIKRPKVIFKIV
jgi:hypothetical protein